MVQSIEHHRDVVTCIALATDFSHTWLVTGSRDCTVVVWDVSPDNVVPVRATPLYTIYGHDDSVTSVCVSPKLDLVVSGSDDGTLMIHNLRDGRYIRSIIVGPAEEPTAAAAGATAAGASTTAALPKASSELADNSIAAEATGGSEQSSSAMRRRINWVGVNDEGFLVVYLMDDGLLCSYTVNGRHLASRTIKDKLHALILSKDGKVLLTGGNNGLVVLRWVHTLHLANTGSRRDLEAIFDGSSDESTATTSTPFNTPIRSLFLTQNERHLIVGLETGEIRVLAQDSDYLRQRLQRKLVEIGIL
jgi:WD40 repeat protein